ncbi:dTDP-4-keto-6-deoxy-D-glucose epimerase [Pseudomonas gingeri NCPPB 3146 = LMG 5327]|uniref:dTDP-4-dehydrorhamnose 3,5-epimerase n=2 Tax=Pseudomonas gingeri TaxID=117681 RepID=A0A7Y8CH34_9PSED|nr:MULTISPECIES: dTDP-4-dehydrorhamnose 3,5-epimerase [Pseudomonas]NVZ30153.1 dTDP-4-dehydrorhamnose 3,5-epimerase family protein [Pseudomonas gingeri]NWA10356.1 dTDP-4-dehydrorhamnose 3,5-epimerase family protein [Pseudomonas gingeri]NWC18599.1 dTDP-4-dehydrorhamnose 3,5-epimerase family protein [Pseudomonas gingeri]NWE49996.1 dTDP-4-dehydrorhamnose 3,5-epimerase family protein [Pseudomonas gingeri]NWE71858.1 dTDP-4-dehydrorhamnose 3,5-epimerase family protein [Pseudomonas gingeri]
MSELLIHPLPLEGLFSVQHKRHADQRGQFSRLFCEGSLSAFGQVFHVRQINHSCTRERGSVRGLHYQNAQAPEAKLITCLRGEVWDVAVDLRPDSPTFLQWHAEHLRAGDGRSLLLPAGFAHGFQTLSDDAELLYLHSADYAPDAEGGLSVLDPRLAIAWPEAVKNLSARDAGHPLLDTSFPGVRL